MFELKINYILVYVSYLLSTVVLNMLRPHRLKFQASLSLCLICSCWLCNFKSVDLWILDICKSFTVDFYRLSSVFY